MRKKSVLLFQTNINKGKNDDIKDRSKTLYQYCYFVESVKDHSKSMPFEQAIDEAVKECISKNILAEFLSKHRKEVKLMCLTEFNEQKYTEMIRGEGEAVGDSKRLIKLVESFASKHNVSIEEACEELSVEVSEYKEAQSIMLENA